MMSLPSTRDYGIINTVGSDSSLTITPVSSTFLVEDGTGLATATSYVSLVEANSIVDLYNQVATVDVWNTLGDSEKQNFIIRSTKLIDTFNDFPGRKLKDLQSLDYPRRNDSAYRNAQELVPKPLRIATALYAQNLADNPNKFEEDSCSSNVTRLGMGSVNIEYDNDYLVANDFVAAPTFPKIVSAFLNELEASSSRASTSFSRY